MTKLGICIPYRNREAHLKVFIPYLSKFLTQKGIEHQFYVAHQVDGNLLNRGLLKNVAAQQAFEDGCDYIAWHDVDMLPQDDCDYGFPKEHPTHIATKLSKYDYGMSYDEYFGGVVLFSKEHAYQTNGYSNEYWDWGQEDDDLFWRCHLEGLTSHKKIYEYPNKKVAYFNGQNSFVGLPSNQKIATTLQKNHTISILFKAEQQPNKYPIYLVGDENRKFVEFPLLRKIKSYNWGLSFNNSKSVSMLLLDEDNKFHYDYGKRMDNMWTWVTLSYNKKQGKVYFYVNDELISHQTGYKEHQPHTVTTPLKKHNPNTPFILGACDHFGVFYKGFIADVKIYNKFFDNIKERFTNNNVILNYNFTETSKNVQISHENIIVEDNILPHRKEGTMECLPHPDEGLVGGGWVKGKTTAKNEYRYVTKMQQGKINYKRDGLSNIKDKMIIKSIDTTSFTNTKILNITTTQC